MFPTYLLNKVYVPKSLKNTTAGFEFTLKNVVESGTLGGVKALLVDGIAAELASVTIETAAGEQNAAAISYRSPLPLRYNAEAVVRVAGSPLSPGKHDIQFTISVLEAGTLELFVSDEIAS